MIHPFAWVPDARLGQALSIATALAVLVAVALLGLSEPLRTASAPAGIVSFELCAFEGTLQRLLTAKGLPHRIEPSRPARGPPQQHLDSGA